MSHDAKDRTVCHPGGSELLLFMPRERADALRLRVKLDPRFSDTHISALYPVGSAWAVRLCRECYVEMHGDSQTPAAPRTVEFV